MEKNQVFGDGQERAELQSSGPVRVVNHSLVADKLSRLRDKHTRNSEMRMLVNELGILVAIEATRNLGRRRVEIETPICSTVSEKLKQDIVLAPIMRAGLAMEEGIRTILPTVATAHIGCFRDEVTLEAHQYFCKSPDVRDQILLILDPMLATGGSMLAAIAEFKKRGFKDIYVLTIISAPEGIAAVHGKYPEIPIYTCAIDERLDEQGWIVPGLGDAGDRIYGAH